MLEKGLLREEDREPVIGPFMWYLEAFSELDTCRNQGAIPFLAIVEYTRLYEIEDADDFIYVIRKIDAAHLEMEANRAEN